ncbi:hypothetical protein [Natrinema halophilum]|uniref:Uncharacterized protein n=1 Tax=Natrinema halophilum TaxID=1699371 RepID=A0A7D5GJF5_9EURY|nr:hypothetical protein [Natrinema halophilum]QLG50507.1 hypothetical protein HYG82_17460 [Natrinema halophilum]
MGERDEAESETALRRYTLAVFDRARRVASRASDSNTVRFARRFWRRFVRERPTDCQVSITFPTGDGGPSIGTIHDWIEDLEIAFEGRLDVYARRRCIRVVTDTVPADQVDIDAVEAIVNRIEMGYDATHSLAHIEKIRFRNGRLVRADVVVPVKPLFPREGTAEPTHVTSTAD